MVNLNIERKHQLVCSVLLLHIQCLKGIVQRWPKVWNRAFQISSNFQLILIVDTRLILMNGSARRKIYYFFFQFWLENNWFFRNRIGETLLQNFFTRLFAIILCMIIILNFWSIRYTARFVNNGLIDLQIGLIFVQPMSQWGSY